MGNRTVVDPNLYQRTKRLLEPGEIELNGIIVHTEIPGPDDLEMTQLTIDVGDRLAEHLTEADTYVYSGTEDPEFASNQHQGLTIADDEFVWECQQLLRNGTYDLVFYYEDGPEINDETIVEDLETEFDVQAVFVEGPQAESTADGHSE